MSTPSSICPSLPRRHSSLILHCRRSGYKQHILWLVLSLSHHRSCLHNYCLRPLLIWGLASFLDIPLTHQAIIYMASLRNVCEDHISLNNSQGRLSFFCTWRGQCFWDRWLFQILLNGSHALNISAVYWFTSSSSKRAMPNGEMVSWFAAVTNKEMSQIIQQAVPKIHEEGDKIWFGSFSFVCLTWIYWWDRWKSFYFTNVNKVLQFISLTYL